MCAIVPSAITVISPRFRWRARKAEATAGQVYDCPFSCPAQTLALHIHQCGRALDSGLPGPRRGFEVWPKPALVLEPASRAVVLNLSNTEAP